MTVKLWGRSLPGVDKQIGVDSCRSPEHLRLFVCVSAPFILADTHMCVFIHNVVVAIAASSHAFIYIPEVLGVFLKLLHREEIHQDGGGKTTEEQESIESTVRGGNNSSWIIESFLCHQPFVPGLMGFFSKRQCEREAKGIYFLFWCNTTKICLSSVRREISCLCPVGMLKNAACTMNYFTALWVILLPHTNRYI